jgi:hypothetical protein
LLLIAEQGQNIQIMLELLGLVHIEFLIISNKCKRPIHAWWEVQLFSPTLLVEMEGSLLKYWVTLYALARVWRRVEREQHTRALARLTGPAPFTVVHFKRWQARVTLWLTAMGVFWVSNDKPEGQLTTEQEKVYEEANTLFVSAIIGSVADHLQDVYLGYKTGKDMWDTLNNDYGGSDAGTELYIIEQYHDYKMVDG